MIQSPYAARAGGVRHYYGPYAMFSGLWNSRQLLRQFVQRDIDSRYRGSWAGLFWSVLNPLTMLAVYTFAFGYLMQSNRALITRAAMAQTAFNIFAGLIVFNLFADAVNRAPSLFTANANYVKKVVFPLDMLCWMAVGSAFFTAMMSLAALAVFYLVAEGPLPVTFALAPLILLPFAFIAAGVVLFLSSLGVYLRDVSQTVGNFISLLIFLSPVFYTETLLPLRIRPYFRLNPLVFPITELRKTALAGQWPDWGGLALYSLAAALIAWAGFVCFQKMRKGFADVL
ncbi:MAG: ABC transporter permease [Elusimicrobiales bacterium]